MMQSVLSCRSARSSAVRHKMSQSVTKLHTVPYFASQNFTHSALHFTKLHGAWCTASQNFTRSSHFVTKRHKTSRVLHFTSQNFTQCSVPFFRMARKMLRCGGLSFTAQDAAFSRPKCKLPFGEMPPSARLQICPCRAAGFPLPMASARISAAWSFLRSCQPVPSQPPVSAATRPCLRHGAGWGGAWLGRCCRSIVKHYGDSPLFHPFLS